MYTADEKPGKGVYKCMKCRELVVLNDDSEILPPCPRCGRIHYTKEED